MPQTFAKQKSKIPRMLRNFLAIVSCLFLFALSNTVRAESMHLAAPIAVLIDAESGAVLFEKRAHESINPSELTCLMTLYTALKLSEKNQKLATASVPVSYEDTQRSQSPRRIYLVSETKVPLKTLLQSIAIVGAEDSCLATARFLSGSYETFAQEMNRLAKSLGMHDSVFTFPIASSNQTSSANDLAILANQIRIEFPEAFAWFSQAEFSFSGHTQKNCNLSLWKSPSINGVMASTSNLNVISSWLRQENEKMIPRSLISVVLNGKNREKTIDESFNLLRQGWLNYDTIKLFDDNTTIARLDVLKGNRDKLDVGFSRAVWVTIPHKLLIARGTGGFSTRVVYMHPLVAPIKKGERIGDLQVSFEENPIASFPLYARHDIGQGGFISRLIDDVRLRTTENYFSGNETRIK